MARWPFICSWENKGFVKDLKQFLYGSQLIWFGRLEGLLWTGGGGILMLLKQSSGLGG